MKNINPPKHLHRFFRWFCHPDLREDIEGDLLETFEENVKCDGSKKAKRIFFKDVLQLFRPGIIRPVEGVYRLNQYGMFQNHVKSAWRNLLKRKRFSTLNILGLSIGMASCILIYQFVRFEKSYDQFHPDIDNLYRLTLEMSGSGNDGLNLMATNHPAAGPAMKADFPQVEESARLFNINNWTNKSSFIYKTDDNQIKTFYEDNIYMADPSLLKVFNYPLIEGNAETALNDPTSVVISESLAKKYFGDENPMGKVITFMYSIKCTVTGVLKDIPENSHLKINALFSTAYLSEKADGLWINPIFYTYLKLVPGTNIDHLEAQLDGFVDKYLGDVMKEYSIRERMYLQPVADIHLHSNLNNEARVNGSYETVAFLSLICVMILFIAWINYINLSTSRSIERAGEVGIRKVVGASKGSLISQFFIESTIINLLAVALALVLVDVAAPGFNSLIGKQFFSGIMSVQFWSQGSNWLILLVTIVGGSLLAGSYPAFVLSSFKPIKIFNGYSSNNKLSFRSVLVVSQFCVAFILIVGTLIVFSQLRFMQNRDLGFNMDQILVVKAPIKTDSTFDNKSELLRNVLLKETNVHYLTASSDIPGHLILNVNTFKKREQTLDEGFMVDYIFVDEQCLDTYEMELVSGRNFSKGLITDRETVIINEIAVEMLGYKSADDAIDQMASTYLGGELADVRIIGVIKNINTRSLAHKQSPMVFPYLIGSKLYKADEDYYSLKISSTDIHQTLTKAEASYKEIFPEGPFEYFFLDDHFNEQYKADQQFGKIFGVFTSLAIIVACLGLFGLVAYVSSTRTKEIGIRKVMGASAMQILTLLSKQFVKLLIIAAVLAVPISCWGGDSWLSNYAYRIEIDGWLFAAATLIVFSIALLTVLWQSISTANANPVDSLRDE